MSNKGIDQKFIHYGIRRDDLSMIEAISGALYGLKIENRDHFMELVNQGAPGQVKPAEWA